MATHKMNRDYRSLKLASIRGKLTKGQYGSHSNDVRYLLTLLELAPKGPKLAPFRIEPSGENNAGLD